MKSSTVAECYRLHSKYVYLLLNYYFLLTWLSGFYTYASIPELVARPVANNIHEFLHGLVLTYCTYYCRTHYVSDTINISVFRYQDWSWYSVFFYFGAFGLGEHIISYEHLKLHVYSPAPATRSPVSQAA